MVSSVPSNKNMSVYLWTREKAHVFLTTQAGLLDYPRPFAGEKWPSWAPDQLGRCLALSQRYFGPRSNPANFPSSLSRANLQELCAMDGCALLCISSRYFKFHFSVILILWQFLLNRKPTLSAFISISYLWHFPYLRFVFPLYGISIS